MKVKLAIDIGASNGRGIVGWNEKNEIKTKEVYRFANGVQQENHHLVWNVEKLYHEVKKCLKYAFEQYDVESVSIDTWGCDYVLLNEDEIINPCYAYRDLRTKELIPEIHKIISFEDLYSHTGTQFQEFNTIYQLYHDKQNGRLNKATDFLMIPEYLIYKLTGIKTKEFTNASTTGLLNHKTLEFDKEIVELLDLPKNLFPKLDHPGKVVGMLKEEVINEVGGNCRVILCATHDTGSAVEGIGIDENQIYISSGTWSLLGVKTSKPLVDIKSMNSNYSNEGGVGYNRYQKNIMGMWLVQRLREELCPEKKYDEIVDEASNSMYEEILDCNDEILLSPKSMIEAFDKLLANNKPKNEADYFKCAYQSLAYSYKKAIEELEKNANQTYDQIYIVGGGAKNSYLNRLTSELTGKKVIALPIEATVIGNLKIQMEEKR